jgi:hypothetical protein
MNEFLNSRKKISDGSIMLVLNSLDIAEHKKIVNFELLNEIAQKIIDKFNLDINMDDKNRLCSLYKEMLNVYDDNLTRNANLKLHSNMGGHNCPEWFKDFISKYPQHFSLSKTYTDYKSELKKFETLYFFYNGDNNRIPSIVFEYDKQLNFVSMNYVEEYRNSNVIKKISKKEDMISDDKNDEFLLLKRFIHLDDTELKEIYPSINDCGANVINVKELKESLSVIEMLNYN